MNDAKFAPPEWSIGLHLKQKCFKDNFELDELINKCFLRANVGKNSFNLRLVNLVFCIPHLDLEVR